MHNKFYSLLKRGVEEGYSDLHLTGGHPVVYRQHGDIVHDNLLKFSHEEMDELISFMLSPRELKILRERYSVDVGATHFNMRMRIHVFNTTRGLSVAIRLLPGKPPAIKDLNIHPSLEDICAWESGLVLVCGNTGSGKSTTLAAIIEGINKLRTAHIVTLEDPIEYRFVSKKAFIEQRELGVTMRSFEQGLVDVLREAPDVIVVGEMREPEVIRLTLNAAEAGHLVLVSLHGTDAQDSVLRICNSFPPEAQDVVRSKLSATLSMLIVQRLYKYPRAGFRVPHLSIMTGTTQIRNLIRENKLNQMEGAIQTGREQGMFTFDKYVSDFLDQLPYLTPPNVTFKPSEEVSREIWYQSPVMFEETDVKRTSQPAPASEMPYPQTGAIEPELEEPLQELIIDEEETLDAVVAEFSKE